MNRSVFNFEEGTAIVTGATSGIGVAIAEMLADVGFKIAVIGRDETRGKKVEQDLELKGVKARFFRADISDEQVCAALLEDVAKWQSDISVLVNCAGILTATPIESISIEEWDRVLGTNLSGTFFMIQKAIPYLKRARFGRIINISSNAGRMGGYANSQSYTASKGGVIALTMGIARQLAPFGITVNVVCPGTTETEMVSKYSDETKEKLKERIPLHRLGTCREVASAVCYLASVEAGFITGGIIDVNGGLYMG